MRNQATQTRGLVMEILGAGSLQAEVRAIARETAVPGEALAMVPQGHRLLLNPSVRL